MSSYISDFSQSFGGPQVRAKTPKASAVDHRHSMLVDQRLSTEMFLRGCSAHPSLSVATVSETSETSSASTTSSTTLRKSSAEEMDEEDDDARDDKYKVNILETSETY